MNSRDNEHSRFLRVCAWIVETVLLTAISIWLIPEGTFHLILTSIALVMAMVSVIEMPWITPWTKPHGYVFLAMVAMLVTLVTGVTLLGWPGISFMFAALVSYLVSVFMAVR